MKDDYLALRLPTALGRALARLAKARGLSRSEVVREAISTYVEPAARPSPSPSVRLVAKDLAAAWASIPRLSPDEVESFTRDIDRGRELVNLDDERWE